MVVDKFFLYFHYLFIFICLFLLLFSCFVLRIHLKKKNNLLLTKKSDYFFIFPQSRMTLSISLSLKLISLCRLVLRSLLPKREGSLETSVRIRKTTPASSSRHEPPSCLLIATLHHSLQLYIHTYKYPHVFALSLTKNHQITTH